MADAGDTNTIVQKVEVEGMDQLQAAVQNMTEMGNVLSRVFGQIKEGVSEADGVGGRALTAVKEGAEAASKAVNSIMGNLNDFKPGAIDAISKSFEAAEQASINFARNAVGWLEEAQKSTGEFGDALNATLPVLMAMGQKSAIEKIPKELRDAETALKSVQRQALQAGASFGTLEFPANFQNARDTVAAYNSAMAEAIVVTQSTQEQVMAVGKTLSNAFSPEMAVTPLENIISSQQALTGSINATNAALLISQATGADASTIADMMGKAYSELSMDVEGAVGMFGSLYDASKRSGLGFSATISTIYDAAKSLKFWGTSIEAVSPLFNRFAESMQGMGKRGLIKETFDAFVTGINQMSLSQRAFLGQRMPGAGGGGALRGALEMEQAIEEGDFEGIAKSLTDTLRQFGGTEIMTRTEALESPGAERQYIMQRKLIGQMLGIQDPAKQDAMLGALRNIDRQGIQGKDAEELKEVMGELLGQGEKTAKDTTTILESATRDVEAAVLSSGEKIYNVLQNFVRSTDVQAAVQEMSTVVSQSAIRGYVDLDDLKGRLQGTTRAKEEIQDRLSEGGLSPEVERSLQERLGQLSQQETAQKMQLEFDTNLQQLFKEASAAGTLSEEDKRKYVAGVPTEDTMELSKLAAFMTLDPMEQRQKELEAKSPEERTKEEMQELVSLKEVIPQMTEALSKFAEDKEDASPLDKLNAVRDEAKRARIAGLGKQAPVTNEAEKSFKKDYEENIAPKTATTVAPKTPTAEGEPDAIAGEAEAPTAKVRKETDTVMAAAATAPKAEKETGQNIIAAPPGRGDTPTPADAERQKLPLDIEVSLKLANGAIVAEGLKAEIKEELFEKGEIRTRINTNANA